MGAVVGILGEESGRISTYFSTWTYFNPSSILILLGVVGGQKDHMKAKKPTLDQQRHDGTWRKFYAAPTQGRCDFTLFDLQIVKNDRKS